MHRTPRRHADALRAVPGATQRWLHVVDVENLIGGAAMSRCDVEELNARYAAAVSVHGTADIVIVACGERSAEAVFFGWDASARRLLRGGRSGADLELLRVLTDEGVRRRFGHVVIASGDGIFWGVARQLADAGVDVTVVSRRDSLSWRLRAAAARVVDIQAVAVPAPAGGPPADPVACDQNLPRDHGRGALPPPS